MSKAYNGGPVFPQETVVLGHPVSEGGMRLRDYFAAKAMAGMCSMPPAPQKDEIDYIATRSYEIADAMLKARTA